MNDAPVPTGISAEDWATTPVAVRVLVLTLIEQVAELRERVNKNSRNSSKPPSSDGPAAPPRQKRKPSGRKRGGQKGHAGRGRSLKPVQSVDRVVELKPTQCATCGALLMGEDANPVRHQVTELPRIEPVVTEYRQHTVECVACGTCNTAERPEDMPTGSFGPRCQATVGYLSGRMGMSQRDIEETMETVFHTDISLGSIPAQEERVSAALKQPVEEACDYVQQQPVNNVDETGWREQTKRCWLWINTTPLVTVFMILATRSADDARRVLGAVAQKVVGSDRWSGYNWLMAQWRQACWAHLTRDFQAFVERGGDAARIGSALLEQVEKTFHLWHRVRDGTLERKDFQVKMRPIQRRVGKLLRQGTTLTCTKTRRTCTNILTLEQSLWTFVRVEGVEPTNNDAERRLRRAVLWRRRSFGTQSEDGSRFVERVLTAVITLRQQQRDVLDYLTEACAAAIRGDKPPSLLPGAALAVVTT
jgi:transposase